MPYGRVPHAEKHGVGKGLDISAVVFVIHPNKDQGEEDPSLGLWARSLYPNNYGPLTNKQAIPLFRKTPQYI